MVYRLPNTDRIPQVEDYVRYCTLQFKNIKTIYKFHK
jgi:hypothetical protein